MSTVSETTAFPADPEAIYASVAPALLERLRERMGVADLAYASPPTAVPGGNETMIWGFELRDAPPPFDGPLILRAYVRGDRHQNQWEWEAAVHNALADAGCPVPRVHDLGVVDALGGAFIIMDRAPGTVMGSELFSAARVLRHLPTMLADIPRTLAETHRALHGVDPAPLRRQLEEQGFPAQFFTVRGWLEKTRHSIATKDHPGLQTGLTWLEEHLPPPADRTVICHGDFHPLNILRQRGAVTGIIDWSKVLFADVEFDVGNTLAILTLTRIRLPAVMQPLLHVATRLIARRYLRDYARDRTLDRGRLEYGEAARICSELSGYEDHLPLQPGTYRPAASAGGWNWPRMVARFHDLTGVRLEHVGAT